MQFGKNQVSDKDLLKTLNQRLTRTGTASQSKISLSVQQGTVTLTGTLQHAIQRTPILKAVSNVPGVRRVVDQMQHIVKKINRQEPPPYSRIREETEVVESAAAPVAEVPSTDVQSTDEPPRPE